MFRPKKRKEILRSTLLKDDQLIIVYCHHGGFFLLPHSSESCSSQWSDHREMMDGAISEAKWSRLTLTLVLAAVSMSSAISGTFSLPFTLYKSFLLCDSTEISNYLNRQCTYWRRKRMLWTPSLASSRHLSSHPQRNAPPRGKVELGLNRSLSFFPLLTHLLRRFFFFGAKIFGDWLGDFSQLLISCSTYFAIIFNFHTITLPIETMGKLYLPSRRTNYIAVSILFWKYNWLEKYIIIICISILFI